MAVALALLPVVVPQIELGAVMVGFGSAWTTTFAELPFEQLLAVALTPMVTPPELSGTSKVMLFVPWPPVSVPPVTLQLKVAFPFAGTDAVLDVLPAQTDDGALIVTLGSVRTGTATEFGLMHEPNAAVTCKTVVPAEPASKVMAVVPWPLVMVPLVIDQL